MEHYVAMTEAGSNIMMPLAIGFVAIIGLAILIFAPLAIRKKIDYRIEMSYARGFGNGKIHGYNKAKLELQADMKINAEVDDGMQQIEKYLDSQP